MVDLHAAADESRTVGGIGWSVQATNHNVEVDVPNDQGVVSQPQVFRSSRAANRTPN
jgi:hypothetical protein